MFSVGVQPTTQGGHHRLTQSIFFTDPDIRSVWSSMSPTFCIKVDEFHAGARWLALLADVITDAKSDQPLKPTDSLGAISKEALIAMGLIRDFRGSWQWAMQPGRCWRYTSSEASAVEQGAKMYQFLPVAERITMAERTARFDAEYDAQLNAAYGAYTQPQLLEMLAALTSRIGSLQKTARREFNGNGGRRSGPAVAAVGARDIGTEKMRLEGFIRRKFPAPAQETAPPSPPNGPFDTGPEKVSEAEMQMRKSEEEIPFKVAALLQATYEATLDEGYSVVIADKGGLYEVAPDRTRKFLAETTPSIKVQKRRYTIPTPLPSHLRRTP